MADDCDHTYQLDRIEPMKTNEDKPPFLVHMTCTVCGDTRAVATLKTRDQIEAEATH